MLLTFLHLFGLSQVTLYMEKREFCDLGTCTEPVGEFWCHLFKFSQRTADERCCGESSFYCALGAYMLHGFLYKAQELTFMRSNLYGSYRERKWKCSFLWRLHFKKSYTHFPQLFFFNVRAYVRASVCQRERGVLQRRVSYNKHIEGSERKCLRQCSLLSVLRTVTLISLSLFYSYFRLI